MERSIAFSPNVPDRALDQEVGKIDDRLGDVDETIRPEIEPQGGGLDGIGGVGGRGGGMPGGGMAAGGAAGLASKLPSPVSGVAMSSALPVALGGAIGVGLLGQMTKASGQLQTTASLFGTAMDLFFRPFGNFLSDALRPFAKAGVSMARNFNQMAKEDGLAVAIASIGADALDAWIDGVANAIQDGLSGDGFGAGDAITLGFTALTAAKLASMLPSVGLGTVLTGMGTGTLTGMLPSIGIGSVLTKLGGAGAAATGGTALVALLGGMISLHDLVDGEISDWNLPAKFGQAMGQGFEDEWPSVADKIEKFFKNNIFAELGEATSEVLEGEGDAAPSEDNQEFSSDLDTGFVNPEGVPILDSAFEAGQETGDWWENNAPDWMPGAATGGRVERTGVARIHRGEMIADPDRLVDELSTAITAAGGGGGGGEVDMAGVRDDLGDVKRLLRQLVNSDTTLEVDGRTFGELASDTRNKQVYDTDITT